MLLKITRGLGTRHDTHVLMATIVIGLGALVLGVFTVKKMLAPKGVVAVELPREEVLALGGKARGPMPEVVYVPNDLARWPVTPPPSAWTGRGAAWPREPCCKSRPSRSRKATRGSPAW